MEAAQRDIEALLDELFIKDLSVNHRGELNSYSILQNVPLERKQSLADSSKRHEMLDRFMGSMCGMGVGDAMGHMYEFLPATDRPNKYSFDLAKMKFNNPSNSFQLKLGQWTDDAAMGLCMADSLIVRRGYDGGDMRVRFWCWWNRGYNNAFRLDDSRDQSVGLGGNISKSLAALGRIRPGERVPPTYDAGTEDAGNGSLMRFAPVALYCHSASLEDLYEVSRQSSYTTHPGIIAAEACSLLAHLIHRALNRPSGAFDPKVFLEDATAEYMKVSGLEGKSGWGYDQMKWLVTGNPEHATERCWRWREGNLDIAATLRARGSSYNGYPVSAGYFGSYSLDGLAMAMWSVYHTTNFNEAVTKSINLLGDADSHGSITGQIAGALYGYSTIHPQFLEWQRKWDENEFAVRALLLYNLGCKSGCARS